VWIVAVKGTFLVGADDRLRLAPKQADVCAAPRFLGDPKTSSLLHDSDLTLAKPKSDVLLLGHAYAPGGKPARQVDVSLRVGSLVKALRIFGDRYWRVGLLGLKLCDPEPFRSMPLTYERAFGGRDPAEPELRWDGRNPAGRGYAFAPDRLAGWHAPNVEYPAEPTVSPRQRPPPAGYGPIACHWEPRLRFGGTYDATWEEERQPLVPEDFDDRFFQSAPDDQQYSGFLRGGERVELYNLTPSGVLAFALPRITLGFETFFSGERALHRAHIQTLILTPDVPGFQIVWQTQLPCHSKVVELRKTRIMIKKRLPLKGAPAAWSFLSGREKSATPQRGP
jgi:hypothetical protein